MHRKVLLLFFIEKKLADEVVHLHMRASNGVSSLYENIKYKYGTIYEVWEWKKLLSTVASFLFYLDELHNIHNVSVALGLFVPTGGLHRYALKLYHTCCYIHFPYSDRFHIVMLGAI